MQQSWPWDSGHPGRDARVTSPQAERNSSHQGFMPPKRLVHLLAMCTHFFKNIYKKPVKRSYLLPFRDDLPWLVPLHSQSPSLLCPPLTPPPQGPLVLTRAVDSLKPDQSLAVITLHFFFFFLFSRSVMTDSFQPNGLQHNRLPWPSPSPRVCSNSCPLSR